MGIFGNLLYRLKQVYTFENKLIKDLKYDHRELFSIFEKIKKMAQKEKYEKIPALLQKFHYQYRMHIIYEDNYFYTYLKNRYHDDPKILKFITQKQAEMHEISNVIAGFVERFSHIKEVEKDAFKKELDKLAKALTKRIEFEEKELYTLYA